METLISLSTKLKDKHILTVEYIKNMNFIVWKCLGPCQYKVYVLYLYIKLHLELQPLLMTDSGFSLCLQVQDGAHSVCSWQADPLCSDAAALFRLG